MLCVRVWMCMSGGVRACVCMRVYVPCVCVCVCVCVRVYDSVIWTLYTHGRGKVCMRMCMRECVGA